MIAILRIFILFFLSIFICIFGSIYCALYKPCNPKHAYTFGKLFGYMSFLFGIKLCIRYPKNIVLPSKCVYISNHQNNFDMITVSRAIQKNTITIGKKSLIWIPFFGILYWISGNLLINRKNKFNLKKNLNNISNIIIKKKISVWIFPEGTRSKIKNLLPFKIGAFYIALNSRVPIIPICVSDTSKIKINKYKNGKVIVEILPPIDTKNYNIKQVRNLTEHCRLLMQKKINEINEEIISEKLKK
ncbi:plsC [Wigglesworthia glossinidia endosymbiont of Glossina brevipalpis]|uniref:1-acyl-sn-glycerol-3-phosphate acyltransferase n=1 Tax=Wigglesworthia glossinidia brevipalpis TaxID=36870 RepID=Q8D256_WIGBR|nr:plsC [Wigglesworthia glossinidia endosymbiont of Glossina brevipalpis]